MNCFYRQSDRELGPVSAETLKELAACGVITDETPVRGADSVDWIAYGEMSGGRTTGGGRANPADPSIVFYCHACGQKISAGQGDTGKSAECPSCGTMVTIPQMPMRPAHPEGTVSEQDSVPGTQSPPLVPAPPAPPDLPRVASAPKPPPPISKPAAATGPAAVPTASQKRHLKPVLIGCGAALLIGCVGAFGLLFAIVGAVNSTTPESPGNHETPTVSQSETVVHQLPPFDPNVWNKRSPCRRCQGSGNLLAQCTRCRGNGTIMTGNPNSLDPMRSPLPSMQVPCPQCRGGGQVPVRCSHCQGTGAN
jgi:hypothetical protein